MNMVHVRRANFIRTIIGTGIVAHHLALSLGDSATQQQRHTVAARLASLLGHCRYLLTRGIVRLLKMVGYSLADWHADTSARQLRYANRTIDFVHRTCRQLADAGIDCRVPDLCEATWIGSSLGAKITFETLKHVASLNDETTLFGDFSDLDLLTIDLRTINVRAYNPANFFR